MRRVLLLSLCACGRIGYDSWTGGDGRGDAAIGDGTIGDGTVNDGALLPPTVCGATVLLNDGFDSGNTTSTWSVSTGIGLTANQLNSNLEIAFAATVNAGRDTYYQSASAYTTDGLCAVTEVAGTPNLADPNATLYFMLYSAAQQVDFYEHGGSLELRRRMNQTVTILATLAWDPTAYRFLRLRHLAGTTYWDTSTDGTNFVQRFSAQGFSPSTCQPELGAGTIAAVTNGGTARFASATVLGP